MIQKKRWETGDWQLHQDNESSHASRLMQSFLAKPQITQVTQSHHSANLALYNFWLFPKPKIPFQGKKFQTVDEIQENMTGNLMVIQKKDFAECFEQ